MLFLPEFMQCEVGRFFHFPKEIQTTPMQHLKWHMMPQTVNRDAIMGIACFDAGLKRKERNEKKKKKTQVLTCHVSFAIRPEIPASYTAVIRIPITLSRTTRSILHERTVTSHNSTDQQQNHPASCASSFEMHPTRVADLMTAAWEKFRVERQRRGPFFLGALPSEEQGHYRLCHYDFCNQRIGREYQSHMLLSRVMEDINDQRARRCHNIAFYENSFVNLSFAVVLKEDFIKLEKMMVQESKTRQLIVDIMLQSHSLLRQYVAREKGVAETRATFRLQRGNLIMFEEQSRNAIANDFTKLLENMRNFFLRLYDVWKRAEAQRNQAMHSLRLKFKSDLLKAHQNVHLQGESFDE